MASVLIKMERYGREIDTHRGKMKGRDSWRQRQFASQREKPGTDHTLAALRRS